MSIKLMVEVIDHGPAELTAQERWLLVCLAERANDETREAWPGHKDLLRRMRVCDWDGVAKVLRSLAAKGYEVRVPITTDRRGRPVYAASGHRSVYRIPRFERSAISADQVAELDIHRKQVASKMVAKC